VEIHDLGSDPGGDGLASHRDLREPEAGGAPGSSPADILPCRATTPWLSDGGWMVLKCTLPEHNGRHYDEAFSLSWRKE
jgi:hypothetical protein